MLTKYVDEAMRRAEYELIPEDGTYYGHIPGFQGAWAGEKTLEECRNELRSVLEDWLLLKLWDNDDNIPILGKLSLIPRTRGRRSNRGPGLETRTRKAS
jgi:predicted RNase H-like HicB family nuclease